MIGVRPLCLALSLALALITRAEAASVIVASKIDAEGQILGAIIAEVLKGNGVPVISRLALGPTSVVRSAILAGDIDLYPEYTGNAAFFFGKEGDPAWKSAEAGYAAAKRLDFDTNRIVWLTPSPADNGWAIAVRRDAAQAGGLSTLSDFSRWVASGAQVKVAALDEFVTSPAALPALQAGYGFTLRRDQILLQPGGDPIATRKAAMDRIEGTNAAVVYGSDGGLEAAGLVVLRDDKAVQPVFLPAPIVRAQALEEHPTIEALLKPVFQNLDLQTLRTLNARVQVDGQEAPRVAHDYLVSKGLAR